MMVRFGSVLHCTRHDDHFRNRAHIVLKEFESLLNYPNSTERDFQLFLYYIQSYYFVMNMVAISLNQLLSPL
jgi:hypothetical protein